MYTPQCLSTRCIGASTSIGDALATGIQAPAGPCKLMNIAIRTNCIKYQMLHVIRECGSTLYVGMPRKQNGRPIHYIVKSSPQNAAIGKF